MYYVLGDLIVSRDEIAEKRATGAIRTLQEAAARRQFDEGIDFSTGRMQLRQLNTVNSYPPGSDPVNLVPTGVGKPCLIKFETIYTGKYGSGFFNKKKDALVTSTMKSLHVSSAQARAVNYLENDLGAHAIRHRPSPNLPGRPVIFYSPALVSMNAAVKFEMAFDDVNDEAFDKTAQILQGFGQLPIFAPYAGYFWAAGSLINIIKQIGKALFDSSAEYVAEDVFDLNPVIGQPFAADVRFYMDDREWAQLSGKYRIHNGVLVEQSGQPYNGDAPYFLVSISGQEVKELEGFVPEAISADIASRFFDSSRLGTVILDTISKGTALFSDMRFWEDAQREEEKRKAALAKTPPDSKGADEAKQRRDAAIANIHDQDLLKLIPKFPDSPTQPASDRKIKNARGEKSES